MASVTMMANVVASLPPKYSTLKLPNNNYRMGSARHVLVRAGGGGSRKAEEGESMVKHLALKRNGVLVGISSMVAAAMAVPLPALAEMEKAKLFDFNLTLPIIAGEFLLLMVALDTIWFKPIGKFMDDRDEAIRQKLLSVRDNSEEIKRLQDEAEAILKAARAEVTAALNQMKKEMAVELDQKLRESRQRVEKELALALDNLERQKQETLQSLDKQIESLSEEIVSKFQQSC
eukprot:Gb_16254 [translate_table: standard]